MSTAQVNSIIQIGSGVNQNSPVEVTPEQNGDKFVWLNAVISGGANGTFYQLVLAGTTADPTIAGPSAVNGGEYQVPSGKRFKIRNIYACGDTGGNSFNIGYATSTFSDATASGSPPSGAVTYCGNPAKGVYVCNTAPFVYHSLPVGGIFPALSFPFIRQGNLTNNTSITIVGVLEA